MNRIARNESEFCGKVPLHQTNLLQPHGYLVILDKNLNILQAGENANEIFQAEVQSLINKPFSNYISGISFGQLKQAAEGNFPLPLRIHSATHLAYIKQQEEYYVVEIEKFPLVQNPVPLNEVYHQIMSLLQKFESSLVVEKFCHEAITELKKISGFDKIMIYRFDANWNGDVIAEVMEEGMDSYLGLKFPSSDVPKQARELYKTMAYRFIPDTKYQPVKLHPVINRITGGFTDLSSSNLRSVASVHLEYLENMKVRSSMSTRIMVKGKLWGLIACHHRSVKFLDYNSCTFFEIFSQLLSSRITWLEDRHAYDQQVYFNGLQIVIMQRLMENRNFYEGLKQVSEELLKLLSAEGFALVMDRKIYSFGKVPKKNDIEDLLIWIHSHGIEGLYHEANMSSVFEPALDYSDVASGLMVLSLHRENGDYLLAFRPEAVTKANWGGNPDEALVFEADGKKYHPRSSFAVLQQTVHHTSIPWQEQELLAAENFMKFIRPLL